MEKPAGAVDTRLLASPLWDNTTDICKWDLTPQGAAELNGWTPAQPDVFYFSWSTEETTRALLSGQQRPELGMISTLKIFARFMGSYTDSKADERWWPNDGVVNPWSMAGPILGSTDRIIVFDGHPRKGVWNHMGLLHTVDHVNILGMPLPTADPPPGYRHVVDWYSDWAAFLHSLR